MTLSPDRPQANIAVRLCDVHPDGASELISYGVLNLTHRNSHEFPQALVPGEACNRTGSARPSRLSRAGRPPAAHCGFERLLADDLAVARAGPARTRRRRHADPAVARRWRRATKSASADPKAPRPGVTETIRAAEFRAPCRSRREDRHGHACRSSTISAKCAISTMACATGSIARETLDHPSRTIRLSARGETHWTQTLSRTDGRCAPKPSPKCGPTRKAFISTPRIEAYEGDSLVFERDFEERSPARPYSERSSDWSKCRHTIYATACRIRSC